MTFDFDTFSFLIGTEEGKSITNLSRGEFGNIGALRIIDLLDRYGIKSTWFTPAYTIESFPETVKEIVARGHEIAHHNYAHETPKGLSREAESDIIDHANKIIEKVSGKRARGYRAPSWEPSENTMELIIEKGFVYDSSLMAHDYVPYFVRIGDDPRKEGGYAFGRNSSLLELPISWSLEDYPVFEYEGGSGLREGKSVERNWIADFDYMTKHLDSGVYILTTHPQVIGRGHRMEVLENVLNHISRREDVLFATMERIAELCISERGGVKA